MKKKSTFLLSTSIYLFLLVFGGFVTLIYIEDIYIFRQLEKNNEILPLIYIGRVLIALSFSILMGIVGFLYIYNFIKNLRKIEQNILYLPRVDSESKLPESYFPYAELDSLNQRLFSVYREEKEKGNQLSFSYLENLQSEFKLKLLPNVFDIKLSQIRSMELSIIPNKSRSTSSDFLGVLETKNGCIVCITGTSKDTLESTIFKFKIKSIFDIFKKISLQCDENLFNIIYSEILESIEIKINFTLIFVFKDTGRILYHKYQNTPLLFFQKSKIFMLEGNSEKELTSGTLPSSPRGLEMLENEFLMILSDRIENIQEFSDSKYIDYIYSQYKWNEFNSSKDFLLQIISILEGWQNQSFKTESLYEHLMCVVIRKK